MARITLYLTNAGQRNKTDHDRMIEVIGLTESLEALRTGTPEHQEKFRELTGLRTPSLPLPMIYRAAVAHRLGLSVTKTGPAKAYQPKIGAGNSWKSLRTRKSAILPLIKRLPAFRRNLKRSWRSRKESLIRDVEEKLESDSKEKGELHRQQSSGNDTSRELSSDNRSTRKTSGSPSKDWALSLKIGPGGILTISSEERKPISLLKCAPEVS